MCWLLLLLFTTKAISESEFNIVGQLSQTFPECISFFHPCRSIMLPSWKKSIFPLLLIDDFCGRQCHTPWLFHFLLWEMKEKTRSGNQASNIFFAAIIGPLFSNTPNADITSPPLSGSIAGGGRRRHAKRKKKAIKPLPNDTTVTIL